MGFGLVGTSNYSITLSWIVSSEGGLQQTFIIEYGTRDSFEHAANFSFSSTGVITADLFVIQHCTNYNVRLKSVNIGGESGYTYINISTICK